MSFKLFLFVFDEDGIHFNKQGHEITANGIKAILASEKVQHSDVVGPWDSHDVCSTWYETGSISLDHSPGLNMYSWARTEGALRGGKFALEIPDSGGWIKVKNPTDKYLGLYMYYMVTAPQQFYPEADVTVSKSLSPVDVGNPEFQMKIRPLDTIHLMSMGVHMIKGTKLGNVGPGEHFVSISPKEKRDRPFRITGIALTEHGKSDEMEGFFQ